MTFPAVNPALERALVARAYTEPTPVQLAVLQAEAAGRDMLVSAQTGSGKTVAFGLALAKGLLGDAERFERAGQPLALIIAPTRELAIQVQRELTWLYAETGASIASCVGGMDPRAERDALRAGAHIVVGTPGRLRDHLERGRLVLSGLKAAVLDEADEMLDLGFRDDLQFILDATPAERQTLMFSATVPREIESLARSYQRDALRIATTVRNQQHDDIEYRAVRTVPNAVEATVVNLLRLHDAPAALVFCATREGVRRLHAGLAKRGFSAVALSGELSQAERTEALERVRSGYAKVLVATDVAARGLDLAELSLVIHADLPNDRETLLHRSGRTGRAGRKGISVLVVPPNRRRKAEDMLGRSRIAAVWESAPTPKEIAARDQERLMALPILDEPATAEDLALGRMLLDGRTPEQVAAALVRMSRIGLPVAENLRDLGRPPLAERAAPRDNTYERKRPAHDAPRQERPAQAKRPERPERTAHYERPERAERPVWQREPMAGSAAVETVQADVGATPVTVAPVETPHVVTPIANDAAQHVPRPERPHYREREQMRERKHENKHDQKREYARSEPTHARPRAEPRDGPRGGRGREDMVVFGLDIGRTKNADVRWLLPMICRVGEVTKREIGSIKVGETQSTFEIKAEHADNFANTVRLSKHKEGRIWRLDEGAAPAPVAGPVPAREPMPERRRDAPPRKPGKPYGRKPDAGARANFRSGDTAGGNAPLKRSWKDKQRRT